MCEYTCLCADVCVCVPCAVHGSMAVCVGASITHASMCAHLGMCRHVRVHVWVSAPVFTCVCVLSFSWSSRSVVEPLFTQSSKLEIHMSKR